MPKGLLDSLAEHDVPPVPVGLGKRLHQRLNRALLTAHLIDLVLGGIPCLTAELLRATAYFVKATFTGRFETDRVDRSHEAP
jgi:hypothetical protein